MGGELYGIVTREGIGGWEQRNQRLIESLIAIEYIGQTSYARLGRPHPQMLRGNLESVRTTQPNEGDCAAAWGTRDGDDCVLHLHGTRAG